MEVWDVTAQDPKLLVYLKVCCCKITVLACLHTYIKSFADKTNGFHPLQA